MASLFRYLPVSLIIHLLIVFLIGLNLQKTKMGDFFMPKAWVIDANLVLQERDLEAVAPLPKAAPEKNAAEAVPEPVAAEPVENETPVSPDAKGPDDALQAMHEHEQAQIQERQWQEAVTARMNMQFLIYHTRAFFKGARISVLSFLFSEMNGGNWEALNGSTASVKLAYGDDGMLRDTAISAESEEFKKLLERISWKAVPQPSSYYLAYKGLDLKITVKDGIPIVAIEVLQTPSVRP